MERYKNLDGNSGVYAFEIGGDYIKVRFLDGSVYLYSYASPGSFEVERMKNLALSGRGLNGFLNTFIKKRYAAKLR